MTLSLDIPDGVESTLRLQFGAALEARAKEDLATAWFSEGRISARQVAELLGLNLFDAHQFLKSRGATTLTVEDLEHDLTALEQLRNS